MKRGSGGERIDGEGESSHGNVKTVGSGTVAVCWLRGCVLCQCCQLCECGLLEEGQRAAGYWGGGGYVELAVR